MKSRGKIEIMQSVPKIQGRDETVDEPQNLDVLKREVEALKMMEMLIREIRQTKENDLRMRFLSSKN